MALVLSDIVNSSYCLIFWHLSLSGDHPHCCCSANTDVSWQCILQKTEAV